MGQPSLRSEKGGRAVEAVAAALDHGNVFGGFKVRLPILRVQALDLARDAKASTLADGIDYLAMLLPMQVHLHSPMPSQQKRVGWFPRALQDGCIPIRTLYENVHLQSSKEHERLKGFEGGGDSFELIFSFKGIPTELEHL